MPTPQPRRQHRRLSAPKSGKMSSSVAPGGPFTRMTKLKGLMNETSLRNLKYTNMFTQMDGDGDGLINAEELRAGLVKLGVKEEQESSDAAAVAVQLRPGNPHLPSRALCRLRYMYLPPARPRHTHTQPVHAARTHFAACTLQARHRWRNPTSSSSRSTSSTRWSSTSARTASSAPSNPFGTRGAGGGQVLQPHHGERGRQRRPRGHHFPPDARAHRAGSDDRGRRSCRGCTS